MAQLPRGPQRSRYYLQCSLTDQPEDWPDARIWHEIRLRTGNAALRDVTVHDRELVPLRAVMHAPLQHGRLYLAGDAAHLVPPTGAKGMNLALFDVDVLARALVGAVLHGDGAALTGYSDAVLPRLWRYHEFSAWMTDTMHDAGDTALNDPYRRLTALARIDALFSSPSAARLHSDYLRGVA